MEQIVGELRTINETLKSPASADEDKTMFPDEAAKYLGVNYDTVLRWAREGIVPSSKPGGQRVLFRKKALDKFLAEQEKQRSPKVKSEPEQEQYGKLRKINA